MTFPAQIVLPSGSEIYRAGQPRPAHPARGSIIIGRVLAPHAGEVLTTADGQPAVRVQFPIGTVLVPIEGAVEAGQQVYAQVREQNGQLLLALLEEIGRGSIFEATALEVSDGRATIDLQGEPAPVDTAQTLAPGQRVLVQVQPRGTRAILEALPSVLAVGEEPTEGVVVSTDGPLATVRVQGVELLGRLASIVEPHDVAPVQLTRAPAGLEIVVGSLEPASPAAGGSETAPAAIVAASPKNDAVIQQLQLPVNAATRTAAAALLESGYAPPAAPASAAPEVATLQAESVAQSTPVAGAAPVLTQAVVRAAVALEAVQAPITPENLKAAAALLDAHVAVTAESVQAARHFLQFNAPITRPAIAAAVALLEIAVTPEPRAAQALANTLYVPSTLNADVATVVQVLSQIAEQVGDGPVQRELLPLIGALGELQVEVPRGEAVPAQIQHATTFGGLHTERLIGAMVDSADAAAESTPQLQAAGRDAAHDLRVVLGQVSRVLDRLAADGGLTAASRSAVENAIGRITERVHGLQLQNLRAPAVEHLTIELPTTPDSGFRTVQLQVYYRHDHRESPEKRRIDERNTTIAVLLDTTRLGPVNTTIGIVDGVLTTDFRVDTPAIAELLMRDAGVLDEALADLGYDVARINAVARHAERQPEAAESTQRIGADGIDVTI